MTRQFIYKLLHMGPAGLARSAAGRLRLLRFKWARRAYLRAAEAAGGLEVGGPSLIFMPDGIMPVYQRLRSLDGANFSRETVWGSSGGTYEYLPGRNTGRHFVCEASDMRAIPSGSYDIVLASHVLEHVANPLKALEEWKRLLRRGGHLLMVLPERSLTFDHRRPVTSLDHLLADRDGGTGEDDLTHLDEILRLHDLERDPPAAPMEKFRARSLDNAGNRCLHHHVFDAALAAAACSAAGLRVVRGDVYGMNIFTLAVKD